MKYLWLCIGLLLAFPASAQTPIVSPQQVIATAAVSSMERQITFQVRWVQSTPVDSTLVAVFLSNDTLPVVYRSSRSPDTISFTVPDDTTTYKFLLINVRRGLASLPAGVNFYFNADEYYQVTRLHVRPKEITVKPGEEVQLCAFFEYNDGSIVMRSRDKGIPTCITEYEKFTEPRKSIGARLRKVDGICLEWTAPDGGTIQGENCSSNTKSPVL